ncbi:MAG: flagellar motor switch protein FliM [Candidatus Omnitrophota bacterium]|jgi:flagellar motor switch protein FliM|nr:MAG: flagellar motor switch protein FliM [Candidatus Omnitrophota bacterium]
MADILSQSEIDALLSAFATGEGPADVDMEEEGKVRDVKVYDFNHPDRFSKDQIRTMHNLHDHFARVFSISLSAFMRTIVEVKLVSVDQISYEEFIRSIPNPTLICIINMDPLEGKGLMELSPTLSFPVVDRLMGGRGNVFKKNRELTEIEQTIIEKVLYRAFDMLHEAWATVIPLNLSLEQSETNPQLLMQLYYPSEMVILMTFEVTMQEISGTLSFCIPYPTLEPIANELSSTSWYAAEKKELSEEDAEVLLDRLRRVDLPLVAYIGKSDVTLRELLDLSEGDVVQLNTRKNEEFVIQIGNEYRYFAKPGISRKHNAIKITRIISGPDDV